MNTGNDYRTSHNFFVFDTISQFQVDLSNSFGEILLADSENRFSGKMFVKFREPYMGFKKLAIFIWENFESSLSPSWKQGWKWNIL